MVEEVGKHRLAAYYGQAMDWPGPGGAFLTQGIGTRDGEPTLGPFANRYVFPDAEVSPDSGYRPGGGMFGLEVCDAESLREHYALTLNAWSQRLEQHHQEAVRVVGEVTYRVWRAYMAMAGYLFRVGRLSLYHTLCVRAEDGRAGLPLTREDGTAAAVDSHPPQRCGLTERFWVGRQGSQFGNVQIRNSSRSVDRMATTPPARGIRCVGMAVVVVEPGNSCHHGMADLEAAANSLHAHLDDCRRGGDRLRRSPPRVVDERLDAVGCGADRGHRSHLRADHTARRHRCRSGRQKI